MNAGRFAVIQTRFLIFIIESSEMPHTIKNWEQAEIKRSASEATHLNAIDLRASEKQLARYLDPPADAYNPLEYSYHLLGDVRGKTILEYGCGSGANTLALARRGAYVIAIDISWDLIRVARQRLLVNGITSGVDLLVGSAHELPLPDESIDIVFGIAILHHLDLALSAREVKRVLVKKGRAIFQEPMRDSKMLKLIRSLIPYQAADVSPFERPLTTIELMEFAKGCSSYHYRAFRLPHSNLIRLIPGLRRFTQRSIQMDAILLRRFPKLGHYATVGVIEVLK